jgi:predicted DNA-binding transcriptional regulator AlpA
MEAAAKRRHTLPPSLPPRGLSREQAAAYIGVSPSHFDSQVKDKVLPEPRLLGGRTLWDIRDLDAAFDQLPYRNNGHSAGARDVYDRCAV